MEYKKKTQWFKTQLVPKTWLFSFLQYIIFKLPLMEHTGNFKRGERAEFIYAQA